MGERIELYQAITFVGIVLFFDFLERRTPGYEVERRRGLALNVLALLIVIVGGEGWKVLVQGGFNIIISPRLIHLAGVYVYMLPGTVRILLGIILADLSLYWVHRAMHRTKLWRTHIFHHSIEEIWWLAGARTSFTHLLLFAIPQTFIAYYLLELSSWEAGVAFSVGVVVNIWIHTNIRVKLGPVEGILITPNFHRIHHGTKGFSGKNLGFVLTLWDRIFGTYVDPRGLEKIDVGFVPTRKRLLRTIIGF